MTDGDDDITPRQRRAVLGGIVALTRILRRCREETSVVELRASWYTADGVMRLSVTKDELVMLEVGDQAWALTAADLAEFEEQAL